MSATVIPRGEGEIIGDTPERRVEILSDEEWLAATWSRFGPHRDGADLHIHRRHTDIFYVLRGELTLRLGLEDESVRVAEGTLVRVPPYVVHGYRNGTDAQLEYLNLHAPGCSFADYLRGLRDGRPFDYDQYESDEGEARPATEAAVGGGEVVLDFPRTRVTLLADIEEIAVAEVRLDPGTAPPAHVHPRHAEEYYVLEGALALTAGERELKVEAGSWVQVPAGIGHAESAADGEPVRFLTLHTPSCGFGSFIRAVGTGASAEDVLDRSGFDLAPVRA